MIQTEPTTATALLGKIDTIVQEIEELRQTLWLQLWPPEQNLTDRLYGALGRGSWDEYDPDLDWQRFAP